MEDTYLLPVFELPVPEKDAEYGSLILHTNALSDEPEQFDLPSTNKTLRYGLLRLNHSLYEHQVPQLRRFINHFIGHDNDLFHNHKSENKYHYRYPLVQYKVLDDKASLLGVTASGVAALESLMAHSGFRERCIEWIGEQFAITEQTEDTLTLHTAPVYKYSLRQYLALNAANMQEWTARPGLLARTGLLERCLTGHILKFASAIRWQLPPRSLQVEILDYRSYTTRLYDTPFIGFDLFFQTNISLPQHIGLGKAVSHGYGTCYPKE